MLAALVVGFLVGMRHALDPDHLVTVTTLSCGRLERPRLMLHGIVWGLGHAATLIVLAALALAAGHAMPAATVRGMQVAVAVLLIVLGGSAVRTAVPAIGHRPLEIRAHTPLPPRRLARTFAVGLAQGMAGSATLLLLALATVHDPWLAFSYVACFAIGSIAGMGALAAVILLPFTRAIARHAQILPIVTLGAGALTLAIGALTLWDARTG
jgi:hypothetical protein